MDTLISVIVPVYNKEKYLRECLDSVLLQDYSSLEILLIDDGSTDKSGEICDEYQERDPRIKVIHQPNAGVSAARNRGLEMMSGHYFTFIDSDDFWDSDYITFLKKNAEEYNAQIAICGTRCFGFTDNVNIESKELPVVFDGLEVAKNVLLAREGLGGSACRALFENSDTIGCCRFINVKCYEDLAYMVETSLRAKCVVVSKQNKYNYRYLLTGSAALQAETVKQNLDKVISLLESNVKEQTPEMQTWIDQRYIKEAINQIRRLGSRDQELYRSLRKGILTRRPIFGLLHTSSYLLYQMLFFGRLPFKLTNKCYGCYRAVRSKLHGQKE